MLGSNIETDMNLKQAKEKLSIYFHIVNESPLIKSKPHGNHYLNDFYNIGIKLQSDKSMEETIVIFKNIEIELGRTLESKNEGVIPIDIDMIFWNEYQVHQDYDRFYFVKECVDNIK